MASKFWGGSDSSASSESDYDSDDSSSISSSSYSSSDESDHGPSKYLQDESSQSSEDERRVIRSFKEKQHESLRKTAREMDSALVTCDWVSLSGLLDKFQKQFVKAQQTGTQMQNIMKLFVRTVVKASAEVNARSQEQDFKRQLSTLQAKAFNSLIQRLKKYLKEFDESDITAAEKRLESHEDSDSEASVQSIQADGKSTAATEHRDKSVKDIMTMAKEDVTFEMVDSKLKEISMSRGKKGIDRMQTVDQLTYIALLAKCPAQECEVILHIISAQFDVAGSMATYMTIPMWRSCLKNVLSLMKLLDANKHISLTNEQESSQRPSNDDIMAGAKIQLCGSLSAFAERLDDEYIKSLQCIDPHSREYILRIQDEGMLLILMREVSNFYESKTRKLHITSLSTRTLEHIYYKRSTTYESLRDFVQAKSQQTKSKYDSDLNVAQQTEVGQDSQLTESYLVGYVFPHGSLFSRIEELSNYIYNNGDERSKARALLCQIFSKALHGQYERAKELLLMSHLQESIMHMDISTQILFNRTMAQLGLCAFQYGHFSDASSFLSDIFSGGRTKELLAQGYAQGRFTERSAEHEKLERRRQMPHHMHINIELLEAVYLVCAMLFEVSDLLCFRQSRALTRTFLRIIENYSRQLFTGPPDSIRDAVMVITRMLLSGEYPEASKLLLDLPVWNLLSRPKAEVLHLVDKRLKAEGLRLYLSHFADQYTSANGDVLCDMFCVTDSKFTSIVNSMVANERVSAIFDEPSRSLIINRSEQSHLQVAATTFSEKVLVLLDASERALDSHVGTETIGSYEDDEAFSRRKSTKNQSEPDEYRSRRTRPEYTSKNYRVHLIDGERGKIKGRDSYGNFVRRKIPTKDKDIARGGKVSSSRAEP